MPAPFERAAPCGLLLALLAVMLAGCAQTAPLWHFEPSPRLVIGSPNESIGNPSLAWTSDGLLLVGVSRKVSKTVGYVVYSSDGQQLDREYAIPVSEDLSTSDQSGPLFGLDRDERAHLLWAETSQAGLHRLTASQRAWDQTAWTSSDVRDGDVAPTNWIAFGALATGPTGQVYTSFLDERNREVESDVSDVWFSRSISGRYFERNVHVATHSCSCCRTAVAASPDGRTVFVAFRGNFDADVRDMAERSVSLCALVPMAGLFTGARNPVHRSSPAEVDFTPHGTPSALPRALRSDWRGRIMVGAPSARHK
jgi:hypothetical protein